MKLEGLQVGDQRIFGSYGPGAPRDVLSELLNGSGYNVMMLGETPSGAPRELTLTARAGEAPGPSPQAIRNEGNDDAIQPTQYSQEQENRPDTPPIPPGTPNGIRTPQQMLENMQRLHDLQQQQQEQQEQQQEQEQQQQDQQPN